MSIQEREKIVQETREKIPPQNAIPIAGHAVNAFVPPRVSIDSDLLVVGASRKIEGVLKSTGFIDTEAGQAPSVTPSTDPWCPSMIPGNSFTVRSKAWKKTPRRPATGGRTTLPAQDARGAGSVELLDIRLRSYRRRRFRPGDHAYVQVDSERRIPRREEESIGRRGSRKLADQNPDGAERRPTVPPEGPRRRSAGFEFKYQTARPGGTLRVLSLCWKGGSPRAQACARRTGPLDHRSGNDRTIDASPTDRGTRRKKQDFFISWHAYPFCTTTYTRAS